MKISQIHVEDFKRLSEVHVSDLGDVVTIGGRNAQGKSSLIDAIWNTLGGKQREVTQPIRDGASKASAEITVEDPDGTGLVVTRTWKGDKSRLVVKPLGSKAELAGGQSVLDTLVGKFAFDPLAFVQQSPKAQRDTLVDLVGLDLTEIDAQRAERYEARTEIGREVKRLQGALDSLDKGPAGLPAEPVNVNALLNERDRAEDVKRNLEETRALYKSVVLEIADLEAQLAAAQRRKTHLHESGLEHVAEMAELRDLDKINEELASADEINGQIRDAKIYRETAELLKAKEAAYEAHTVRINQLDAEKAANLENANLPIEGLSFDDEAVLYNGIPLSQASAAERIRISFAMVAAGHPELRVACLKDATLLDEESLALLRQIAAESDFQLFLEMVGTAAEHTVVIEDGAVA